MCRRYRRCGRLEDFAVSLAVTVIGRALLGSLLVPDLIGSRRPPRGLDVTDQAGQLEALSRKFFRRAELAKYPLIRSSNRRVNFIRLTQRGKKLHEECDAPQYVQRLGIGIK